MPAGAPAASPVPASIGVSEQPAPTISAEAEAFVRVWFDSHFPGSEVARNTRAYAVAHAAARDLMARLTSKGVK